MRLVQAWDDDGVTEPTADAGAEADVDAGGEIGAGEIGAPRPRRRGRETARDMVWSMAVVGIFVAFLVVVTYRDKPDAVRVIDPAESLAVAQALAPFDVVAPVGLPPTWQATSARYESATTSAVPNAALWHVGYVTPSRDYAALDQAEGEPSVLVRTLVDGAQERGGGTGAFAGWQRWESADGERRAYVLKGPDSSLTIHGNADDAELAVLAGSLTPPPTP